MAAAGVLAVVGLTAFSTARWLRWAIGLAQRTTRAAGVQSSRSRRLETRAAEWTHAATVHAPAQGASKGPSQVPPAHENASTGAMLRAVGEDHTDSYVVTDAVAILAVANCPKAPRAVTGSTWTPCPWWKSPSTTHTQARNTVFGRLVEQWGRPVSSSTARARQGKRARCSGSTRRARMVSNGCQQIL